MKFGKFICVVIGVMLLAGLSLFVFTRSSCKSSVEVLFSGGESPADAVFRIKNACSYITDEKTLDKISGRIISENRSLSITKAELRQLFGEVHLSVRSAPDVSVRFELNNISGNDAGMILDLFVKEIDRYFEDEWQGQKKKMTAWFDLQIHHHRMKKEDVGKLELAKKTVIDEAEHKALRVCRIDKVSKKD